MATKIGEDDRAIEDGFWTMWAGIPRICYQGALRTPMELVTFVNSTIEDWRQAYEKERAENMKVDREGAK